MAEEFRSGLTWITLLSIILASAIFTPIIIYTTISDLPGISGVLVYIILLIFWFFARNSGRDLNSHEILTIYESLQLSSSIGGQVIALGLLQVFAIKVIPLSKNLTVNGRPLPDLIPSWLAPNINIINSRTFLRPEVALPLIILAAFLTFYFMQEFSMTMINSYLFIEVNKLDFPFAVLDASISRVLATREPKIWYPFILGAYIGAAYALLQRMGLMAGGILMNVYELIPFTEYAMPGAIIGVSTDILTYFYGMLLPLSTATYIFLGSVAFWIFGNHIFLRYFPNIFPEWAKEFRYGMNMSALQQRSWLRIWLSPQFGAMVGLALFVLVRNAKYIIQTFKAFSIIKGGEMQKLGYPPLKVILLLYIGGGIGTILLFWLLMPKLVFLATVLSLGASFIFATLGSRIIGDLGFPTTIPLLWQSTLYFMGYNNVDAWLLPVFLSGGMNRGASTGTFVIAGNLTPSWVNTIRAAYYTKTKPGSLLKAYALVIILANVFGLITLEFLWRAAPIPSIVYSSTLGWPFQIYNDYLLMTKEIKLYPNVIMVSAVLFAGLGALNEVTMKFFNFPVSAIGLLGGLSQLPPQAMALFIGSLINRVWLSKYMARKGIDWSTTGPALMVGFAVGSSIVVGLFVAMSLASRATWVWPY
ncbi:MAG: hypothetical protein J7K23_05890 [Thermoproteales archaeon]|nr:hypothetical protein [Thermoproteales archaeon]